MAPKKGKRKVQGAPQSQTAALPRHQEEEETEKAKQAQIEQTFCRLTSRDKHTPFWLLLEETDPDIIIGCETWLHQGIHESEVLPPGYQMVPRKDKQIIMVELWLQFVTASTAQRSACRLVQS